MAETIVDSWVDEELLSGSTPVPEGARSPLQPEAITFRQLLAEAPQIITPRQLEVFKRPPPSSELAQVLIPNETVEWVVRVLPHHAKAQMGEELFRLSVRACASHDLSALAKAVGFWEAQARAAIGQEAVRRSSSVGHDESALAIATRAREYAHFLVYELSVVTEVERVFVKLDDEVFRVWVVISEPSRDIEDRIYDAELWLMDHFPDALFDFSLIFRGNQSVGEMCPNGAIEVSLRA